MNHPLDEHIPQAHQMEKLNQQYSLKEPQIGKHVNVHRGSSKTPFTQDAHDGLWKRQHNTALHEATLLCAGSVRNERLFELQATYGDEKNYRPFFKFLAPLINDSDLAICSFGSLVAQDYPTLSQLNERHTGSRYTNSPQELLAALRYAGFDAVALANPNSVTLGLRGALETVSNAKQHGLVPAGVGEEKAPVFEVNGINIALLSHTLNLYGLNEYVHPDAHDLLFNHFNQEHFAAEVNDAKRRGAEVVFAYIDCASNEGLMDTATRISRAKELAEAGADYVICNLPGYLTRYLQYETSDGRVVPIASALSSIVAMLVHEKRTATAVLKITVRKLLDGSIEIVDQFIAAERVNHHRGNGKCTVPAHAQYNTYFTGGEFQLIEDRVQRHLGQEIAADPGEIVTIKSHQQPQLSPREISAVLGVEFSATDIQKLGTAIDRKVSVIADIRTMLRPDCVAVVPPKTYKINMSDPSKAQATCVIATTPHPSIPTLVVSDPAAAYVTLMTHIKSLYNLVTAAITGSSGKTTTREMVGLALERQYHTLQVQGNLTALGGVGLTVQKLSKKYDAYVQEVAGNIPGWASNASRVLRPNVCLVTNITDAHLSKMGTAEHVAQAKLEIVHGMHPDGTLILNLDDPLLVKYAPDVRTVWYSISDPNADFYARDISVTGSGQSFTIHSALGVFDAQLSVRGVHNVSNALAAFAVALLSGVTPERALSGISRYRPRANRQNTRRVGDYTFMIDAYNSNPLSLESALRTLAEYPVQPGSRRIAVLGDMAEQGDKSISNHTAAGEIASTLSLDELICFGDHVKFLADQAQKSGLPARHFEDLSEFKDSILQTISPGDVVLFKASGSVNLTERVISPLFGNVY